MNIYIVVKNDPNGNIRFLESVWSTMELAQSAILFHANNEMCSVGWFSIIEREVNTEAKDASNAKHVND